MNMHTLRNYKNRYCNQCTMQGCSHCKVKNFIGYVGLQESPHSEFRESMRTNMPVDVEYKNGKFVQKHGQVVK